MIIPNFDQLLNMHTHMYIDLSDADDYDRRKFFESKTPSRMEADQEMF